MCFDISTKKHGQFLKKKKKHKKSINDATNNLPNLYSSKDLSESAVERGNAATILCK